jgi:hypothetical protein
VVAEELYASRCAVHSAALRRHNIAGAAAAAADGDCAHAPCGDGEACLHASAASVGRLEFPLEAAEVGELRSNLGYICP